MIIATPLPPSPTTASNSAYCDGALVVTKDKINVVNTYGFSLCYACDDGVRPGGTPGLIANNFITNFGNNSKGITPIPILIRISITTVSMFWAIPIPAPSKITPVPTSTWSTTSSPLPMAGMPMWSIPQRQSATSDYNDHYTTGTNLAYWGSTNYTSLAALQAASSKDVHSISAIPGFISSTNLHVKGIAVDSSATPLTAVTDDIDGAPRDASLSGYWCR